ncbi:NmrA-like family protein [Metarhizium robertsii]|uniref:NmrA family protein n=2 Tax=Metarhizium robertsii TaxID=568076 RepID=E9F358_METRA|nr:NmrA family protein [Metarhizium robertsii ARSEF 23]EFY97924.1 NmrA family protein [Metarhizium robertsii ARSEF 23]EXV00510.1 NmrA-like family protein [Metarhizium robertsii]
MQADDIILLTLAAGKQMSYLLPLLYGKCRLRLSVHTDSEKALLEKKYPGSEVVKGDMERAEDVSSMLSGVTTVIYIGPTFHPRETEIGYSMIDAAASEAQNGQLKHFIYSSVLHSQLRKLMNHDCKRYVEEYLMESGLSYTILQPTHMLDPFPVEDLMRQEQPVWHADYDPKVTFSFTVLRDLADAFAVVALEREKHYLAEYPISSTGAVSHVAVVEALSKEIGKDIAIKQKGYYEAVGGLHGLLVRANGRLDQRVSRDITDRLILYYNTYGLKGNTNVLQWLIGRKPTSIEEFFHDKVSSIRQSGK